MYSLTYPILGNSVVDGFEKHERDNDPHEPPKQHHPQIIVQKMNQSRDDSNHFDIEYFDKGFDI
jgi:hypothetical protein